MLLYDPGPQLGNLVLMPVVYTCTAKPPEDELQDLCPFPIF